MFEVFAGDPPPLRTHKRATREAVAAAVLQMTQGAYDAAAAGLVGVYDACPEDHVMVALVDECRRRRGRG